LFDISVFVKNFANHSLHTQAILI